MLSFLTNKVHTCSTSLCSSQVTAVDQPVDGLNSTAQLNITVLDYNDNTPQFIDLPDPIFITEGEYSASTPGEVHRIMATDSDTGAIADVTISLSSPSTLFQFREVDQISSITVNKPGLLGLPALIKEK